MKETTKINLRNHAMSDQAKQNNAISKSGSNDVLDALIEIKKALQDTWEFENYECDNGPTLGTCTDKTCLHCRVKRILDKARI